MNSVSDTCKLSYFMIIKLLACNSTASIIEDVSTIETEVHLDFYSAKGETSEFTDLIVHIYGK